MKLHTVIEQPSLTVELSNGMRVTIYDAGEWRERPVITVRQESRDLLNGAPSAPDVPRYAPGGEYEFALPDAYEIGERCDDPHDTRPGEHHATIRVDHRH
jgi:hypothetical protein